MSSILETNIARHIPIAKLPYQQCCSIAEHVEPFQRRFVRRANYWSAFLSSFSLQNSASLHEDWPTVVLVEQADLLYVGTARLNRKVGLIIHCYLVISFI